MTSILSVISSRSGTPLPEDAPPSVQSISSARKHAREVTKKRLFHTINYTPRTSHFDPQSDYSDFRGFFVLFWMGLAIMVITTAFKNIKETGYPLRAALYEELAENVVSLAIADVCMVGSTVFSLYLHRKFRASHGLLQWRRGGIWVQSIYQAVWLVVFTEWPFLQNWTWTAQVFFALHTLTFLMKMHSYAFYNGHLSETARRLQELDQPSTANVSRDKAVRYPSSIRLQSITAESIVSSEDSTPDEQTRAELDREKQKLELKELRDDLAAELTSTMGNVTYPQNLTLANYLDYVLCPTLCYELEYPRTPKIRWLEVFYKTLAVFGCIFLMTVISSEFVNPIITETSAALNRSATLSDQVLVLMEAISIMLFPFMILFLLTFLVIWEYALGAFAELSCFADRNFYDDWWNCEDWLEFSREWNIPVYHFLRRHVYSPTRRLTNHTIATIVTFVLSSFGHELIMGCISKKLRGYSVFAMMLQLPVTALQRTKYVRGRWVLNNAFFWGSIVLGITGIAVLYSIV